MWPQNDVHSEQPYLTLILESYSVFVFHQKVNCWSPEFGLWLRLSNKTLWLEKDCVFGTWAEFWETLFFFMLQKIKEIQYVVICHICCVCNVSLLIESVINWHYDFVNISVALGLGIVFVFFAIL